MILVRKYIIVNKLLSIKVMTISIKLLGNIKFEKENKQNSETFISDANKKYDQIQMHHLHELMQRKSLSVY